MMYCTYPCLLHDAHVMVPTTALPALAEQERLAAIGAVALKWYRDGLSIEALRAGETPTSDLRRAITAALEEA